jgi:hypothetical protein
MNTNKTTDMERKLELRDICGYLPYGLLAKIKAGGERICETAAISSTNYISSVPARPGVTGFEGLYLSGIIPILRPLSDLYRTITHNGEEIAPLVELAKIASKNQKLNLNWEIEKSSIYACSWNSEHTKILCKFSFRENEFTFTMINWEFTTIAPTIRVKCSQYQLFDYLNELKIDYRGLIDSGLAIDAGTLETDPYK